MRAVFAHIRRALENPAGQAPAPEGMQRRHRRAALRKAELRETAEALLH